MAVDPLTELVTLLQPSVRFSKLVECFGPWKIRRPGTGDPFFCAVLEGRCRTVVKGHPPLILEAGDFLLVPAMHDLTNESVPAPEDETTTVPVQDGKGRFRIGPEGGPVDLRMRIGHCRFASPDAALLVPLLPSVVVARGEPRFATLMQLVADETHADRPARELVLERLLEVLLIEALRSGDETAAMPGLARGLADMRLAAALHAMHAHPERAWTIADLAGEASLSRAAFFSRFDRIVGLKPMEYLFAWRMALAGRLLCERELGLDEVAERVGYSSASTFSVAFARHTGETPARYGRLQTGRLSRPAPETVDAG
ncbi:helix-turn-helix transcriptional regulator [Rhizobium bangladeshense]|uniref:helix-turn-helix transcriptional regulator n=1 Tax=Rhizobium bangladeshense TaxID=1138189 RepID=UPI001C8366AA|nr:AraC family transcriptional regulator [Rhizobium bangladeshense]MBX4898706.1 AraC family transcriptional regulator [Rhizobium bangladeshense]MBY3616729.1 AraC family transcriptional regulator [Rhizobium bangladeshense]